uniref:Uncharacterized protein n=1 Tax=Anopheles coluzzii TaxID=1518534 RepID=A0A8W7PJ81_ANOCL
MRNGGIYIEASIDHTLIGQDMDPEMLARVVFDNVGPQVPHRLDNKACRANLGSKLMSCSSALRECPRFRVPTSPMANKIGQPSGGLTLTYGRADTARCERCSDGSSFGFVSASRADIDWAAPPCGLWPWACAATSDWPPPSPPMPPPTLPVSAFFFCLRSLARRFWNQIFTCRSDSCRFWASSAFRRIVM